MKTANYIRGMKQLDILFIHPNASAEIYQELSKDHSAIETPIWAGMLAQHVRLKGFGVQILDCEVEHLNAKDAANIIKDINPRIACLVVYGQQPSASTQNMEGSVALVEEIKKVAPGIKTLMVGAHVAALPDEVLRYNAVDFICQNEGVYTISNLLQVEDLDNTLYLEKVDGLGWKKHSFAQLNKSSPIVPHEKLGEDLPGIAWDLLPPPSKYRTSGWHAWSNGSIKTPFASLYTSLGCPFKCSFCLDENTKVIVSNGRNKKIKDITKDDKLLAYDTDKLEIVETSIQEIASRKVGKLLKITLSDGKTIKATHEHPFFVCGKWIDAKDLKVGDNCLVIDSSDKRSFFARNYNSAWKEGAAQKGADTRKKNGYVPYMCTEEGIKKIAAAAKKRASGPDNPMLKAENRLAASLRMRGEKNPSWQGGISIMYQNYPTEFSAHLKRKIKKRDNYTCQECSKSKKDGKLDVHHIDYDKTNNVMCNLITLCSVCHTKTNFRRDEWKLHFREKMLCYDNCPHYVAISKIEELNGDFTVYNFQCDPYNNFFAENILTHNCMINIINRTDGSPGVASDKSAVFRHWSPDHIIKEFDKIAAMGVKNVKIADELFVLREQHFMEVCDRLIERNHGFNIWAYSRVDTCKPQYLEKLKKAGVNWLALGIESPNQTVRKDVVKGGYKEVKIVDLLHMISEAGIHVGANYIFGLPEDTRETMQETLDFAMDAKTENCNVYSTMAYPGSPLYYVAKESGWQLPDRYSGYSQHSYYTQNLPSKNLSAAEVLKFRDEAWMKYFTNESYLVMMESKFGKPAVDNIRATTQIKLKRRLLGD
jgi:radical SAM superfamily enzyme YgiQ (UPF0313 family)/5-methylcytosine-specific restriction endonuclease McrA